MFTRARNVSDCGSRDEKGRLPGVLAVARVGCYEAALLRDFPDGFLLPTIGYGGRGQFRANGSIT